jgi:hypothetical protein
MTAAPARVALARPARDTRLDVLRGWLQFTIFASHASGSFIGGWLIHSSWGLSDSSELFVFLSGFTLGSVFARKSLRDGLRSASADMLRRTLRLYVTNLVVFALFGAMLVAGSCLFPGEATRLGWGFLLHDPLRAVPAALTTLYQPMFMGILPIFIWCMLLLPFFSAAEARFGDAALLGPAALYAAAHLAGLWIPSLSPDTGIAFNLFSWQAIFMLGAWLGRRALLRGEALPWARLRGWLWLALAVLLAGLLLRLAWYGALPWPAPIPEGPLVVGKENLALPRLVHAMALAFAVALLVPRDAPWMHRPFGRALAVVGRHSLHVFCVGLFLSWLASAAFRLWPGHWWLDPLLIGTGCSLLALFAVALERRHRPVRRMAGVRVASA